MEHLNTVDSESRRLQVHDILHEAERKSNPEPQINELTDLLGPDALDKLLKERTLPTGAVLRVWRRAGRGPRLEDLAGRTYRFGIWPTRRKYKSRTIEIRGDRRLKDFDKKIREVFDLDTADHISEFFLAIGRGWDSWGLGPIYPDGTGKGAEIVVGDLKLPEGDRMSYLHDWGRKNRFILTLKGTDLRDDTSG